MNESLIDLGLVLVCATCESEIDFTADLVTEIGMCRQCGMAFLVEAPPAERPADTSA
ncbi:MAG: hypothetical protein ACR2FE_04805 [Aeromicrobium sp.]